MKRTRKPCGEHHWFWESLAWHWFCRKCHKVSHANKPRGKVHECGYIE